MYINRILVGLVLITFLISCGESGPTLCECSELKVRAFEESEMKRKKMKAFKASHAEEYLNCEKLGDRMNVEMKGLDFEARAEKLNDIKASCPAMAKLEELEAAKSNASFSDLWEEAKISIEEEVVGALDELGNATEEVIEEIEDASKKVIEDVLDEIGE